MLKADSFIMYQQQPVQEVIGCGTYTYELLLMTNGCVSKMWINANTYKDAVLFFCRRFALRNKSKHKISSYGLSAYRITAVNPVTRSKPYEDALIRKVY